MDGSDGKKLLRVGLPINPSPELRPRVRVPALERPLNSFARLASIWIIPSIHVDQL